MPLSITDQRKIDRTIDALPDRTISGREVEWLDGGLEKAVEHKEKARLAFLSYPIESLVDARAKANHARWPKVMNWIKPHWNYCCFR
ncbi:hypothetical protein [Phyllobacterium zundukense]|nr:hypothetical protein [Phyllobacterium zundukense]